jgi:hypothetical protein
MKKTIILMFLLGILLQISISSALLNPANITNPTQGSDLASNVNITWTTATSANSTSNLNYYNLSFRYTNGTKVKDLIKDTFEIFKTNTSSLTLSDLNTPYLMLNFSVGASIEKYATTLWCFGGGTAEAKIMTRIMLSNNALIEENSSSVINCDANGETGKDIVHGLITAYNNTITTSYMEVYGFAMTAVDPTINITNVTITTGTLSKDSYRWLDLTTINSSIGEYGFFLDSFDEYGSYTTNITFNLTRGAKRLTTNFYNESDGSTVGGNINLDFISSTFSKSAVVTSGTATIILQPETYDVRYSASTFNERTSRLTFTNNSDETVNLYMIKSSTASNITITVVDEIVNPLEGYVVKALKYDITTNTYILQQAAVTDVNGKVVMSLTLNDEYYKFMIEKDGELLTTTNAAYLISETLTIPVTTRSSIGEEYQEYEAINFDLSYVSTTNSFRLEYSDSRGLLSQACLRVYKYTNTTQTLFNSSCAYTPSSIILLGVTNNSGEVYLAKATYGTDEKFLAQMFKEFPKSNAISNSFGLFLQMILTIGVSAFVTINVVLAALLIPLSLILGKVVGINNLDWAALITLQLVGVIVAFILGGKR